MPFKQKPLKQNFALNLKIQKGLKHLEWISFKNHFGICSSVIFQVKKYNFTKNKN